MRERIKINNKYGAWEIDFNRYGDQPRKRWNLFRNGTHLGTCPSKNEAIYRAENWEDV